MAGTGLNDFDGAIKTSISNLDKKLNHIYEKYTKLAKYDRYLDTIDPRTQEVVERGMEVSGSSDSDANFAGFDEDDLAGFDEDLAGFDEDLAGSDEDLAGSDEEDLAGSGEDLTGSYSSEDSADSDGDSTGYDTDASGPSTRRCNPVATSSLHKDQSEDESTVQSKTVVSIGDDEKEQMEETSVVREASGIERSSVVAERWLGEITRGKDDVSSEGENKAVFSSVDRNTNEETVPVENSEHNTEHSVVAGTKKKMRKAEPLHQDSDKNGQTFSFTKETDGGISGSDVKILSPTPKKGKAHSAQSIVALPSTVEAFEKFFNTFTKDYLQRRKQPKRCPTTTTGDRKLQREVLQVIDLETTHHLVAVQDTAVALRKSHCKAPEKAPESSGKTVAQGGKASRLEGSEETDCAASKLTSRDSGVNTVAAKVATQPMSTTVERADQKQMQQHCCLDAVCTQQEQSQNYSQELRDGLFEKTASLAAPAFRIAPPQSRHTDAQIRASHDIFGKSDVTGTPDTNQCNPNANRSSPRAQSPTRHLTDLTNPRPLGSPGGKDLNQLSRRTNNSRLDRTDGANVDLVAPQTQNSGTGQPEESKSRKSDISGVYFFGDTSLKGEETLSQQTTIAWEESIRSPNRRKAKPNPKKGSEMIFIDLTSDAEEAVEPVYEKQPISHNVHPQPMINVHPQPMIKDKGQTHALKLLRRDEASQPLRNQKYPTEVARPMGAARSYKGDDSVTHAEELFEALFQGSPQSRKLLLEMKQSNTFLSPVHFHGRDVTPGRRNTSSDVTRSHSPNVNFSGNDITLPGNPDVSSDGLKCDLKRSQNSKLIPSEMGCDFTLLASPVVITPVKEVTNNLASENNRSLPFCGMSSQEVGTETPGGGDSQRKAISKHMDTTASAELFEDSRKAVPAQVKESTHDLRQKESASALQSVWRNMKKQCMEQSFQASSAERSPSNSPVKEMKHDTEVPGKETARNNFDNHFANEPAVSVSSRDGVLNVSECEENVLTCRVASGLVVKNCHVVLCRLATSPDANSGRCKRCAQVSKSNTSRRVNSSATPLLKDTSDEGDTSCHESRLSSYEADVSHDKSSEEDTSLHKSTVTSSDVSEKGDTSSYKSSVTSCQVNSSPPHASGSTSRVNTSTPRRVGTPLPALDISLIRGPDPSVIQGPWASARAREREAPETSCHPRDTPGRSPKNVQWKIPAGNAVQNQVSGAGNGKRKRQESGDAAETEVGRRKCRAIVSRDRDEPCDTSSWNACCRLVQSPPQNVKSCARNVSSSSRHNTKRRAQNSSVESAEDVRSAVPASSRHCAGGNETVEATGGQSLTQWRAWKHNNRDEWKTGGVKPITDSNDCTPAWIRERTSKQQYTWRPPVKANSASVYSFTSEIEESTAHAQDLTFHARRSDKTYGSRRDRLTSGKDRKSLSSSTWDCHGGCVSPNSDGASQSDDSAGLNQASVDSLSTDAVAGLECNDEVLLLEDWTPLEQ